MSSAQQLFSRLALAYLHKDGQQQPVCARGPRLDVYGACLKVQKEGTPPPWNETVGFIGRPGLGSS